MADFESAAPVEQERVAELHVQGRLPSRPEDERPWQLYVGLIAGALVVGAGLTALGLQVRDGFDNRRDWVVPLIAMGGAIGGVCFVHLLMRQSLAWLSIAASFLLLTVVLVIGNIWAGEARNDPDTAQTWTAAAGGVTFGLMVVALVWGSVWLEATNPTRPPEREIAA